MLGSCFAKFCRSSDTTPICKDLYHCFMLQLILFIFLRYTNLFIVRLKIMSDVFDKQKEQSLKGLDHSKKGSFDAPIHDLIVFINSQKNFFTTSSCSGRIHIFHEVSR